MTDASEAPGPASEAPVPASDVPPEEHHEGRLRQFEREVEDQFGFRQLVREYLIPVETNSIWYSLGGVLAISLALEIVTGLLLTYAYVPDAGLAYGITANLLNSAGWSIVINFHFYNAFLIFGLVMVHMVRVFITGSYRGGKTGLWLVGVGLAAFTFVISLTGEALHWDEVGFGVPWNIGEVMEATGLAGFFNYATDGLLTLSTATEKLAQLYALHISIVPILLGVFIAWHYLLIRFKGISSPSGCVRAAGPRPSAGTCARGSYTAPSCSGLSWCSPSCCRAIQVSHRRSSRRRPCSGPPKIQEALASSQPSRSAGREA